MSTKSDLMRTFTVGSEWNRINHQHPTKMGTAVAAKDEPLKVKVVAQHRNDGIVFQLPSGDHSWLSWPRPEYMQAQVTPDKVIITNQRGPLLTYTKDTPLAESIVSKLLI